MVEFSVLHPAFVARFVQREWGWRRATVELWNRSVSDTYRLVQGRRCAYLKIYPHGWRTREQIGAEIALLHYLTEKGVGVAQPISDECGRLIKSFQAPEGRRYAVLFSEAEGDMPEFNIENSRKYGLLAAEFHIATDLLPRRLCRPHLGIEHIVHGPLRRAGSFLASRPKDHAYLRQLSGDLVKAVRRLLPRSSPVFGMCHGDLTFGNVRRNYEGQLTLFDLDCSGYGWRAYDVAVFLQSRGIEFTRQAVTSRMRQWNAFMEGYHAVRCLSGRELEAVNLFVPLREVWQLGMHSNNLTYMGRRGRRDARFESRLAFIKNWLKACNLD